MYTHPLFDLPKKLMSNRCLNKKGLIDVHLLNAICI